MSQFRQAPTTNNIAHHLKVILPDSVTFPCVLNAISLSLREFTGAYYLTLLAHSKDQGPS